LGGAPKNGKKKRFDLCFSLKKGKGEQKGQLYHQLLLKRDEEEGVLESIFSDLKRGGKE